MTDPLPEVNRDLRQDLWGCAVLVMLGMLACLAAVLTILTIKLLS